MDTRIMKIRRIIALALTAAAVILSIMLMSMQTSLAEGEDGENDKDRPEITVEVVEKIPAADIEEQETPLAESPDTAAADNTRQTMNIWILGAVVIAYAVFIITGSRRRKARRQMKAGTEGDRGSTPAGGGQ